MVVRLTFFLCLLAIFILAFENYLLISLSYLLIGMFGSLLLSILSSSVFWILTLSQMVSWQRFSTILHSASFTRFTVLSTVWEGLNFMQSHFSILGITSWVTRVLFRKSLPIPVSHSVFWLYLLTVSECQVLHWWFWLIWSPVRVPDKSSSLPHANILFSQQHVLNKLPSLQDVLLIPLSKTRGL